MKSELSDLHAKANPHCCKVPPMLMGLSGHCIFLPARERSVFRIFGTHFKKTIQGGKFPIPVSSLRH